MFKVLTEIGEPDPRYAVMSYIDLKNGHTRPAEIGDIHSMVAGIELQSHVPAHVQTQFDKARNAFVYSWFSYDMATLAEQQAYAVGHLEKPVAAFGWR